MPLSTLPYGASYFQAGDPIDIAKLFADINYLSQYLNGANIGLAQLAVNGVESSVSASAKGLTGDTDTQIVFKTGANCTVNAKSFTLLMETSGTGPYTVTYSLQYYSSGAWYPALVAATSSFAKDVPKTVTLTGSPLLPADTVCRLRLSANFGADTVNLYPSLQLAIKLAAV